MSVAEAEVRMTALRARERGHDLRHWTDSFLSQLLDSAADGARADKVVTNSAAPVNSLPLHQADPSSEKLKIEDFGSILDKYMQEPGWTKLCLLLDYDGWVCG